MRRALAARQRLEAINPDVVTRGSFDSDPAWGHASGRTGATALCALTLLTPMRVRRPHD